MRNGTGVENLTEGEQRKFLEMAKEFCRGVISHSMQEIDKAKRKANRKQPITDAEWSVVAPRFMYHVVTLMGAEAHLKALEAGELHL